MDNGKYSYNYSDKKHMSTQLRKVLDLSLLFLLATCSTFLLLTSPSSRWWDSLNDKVTTQQQSIRIWSHTKTLFLICSILKL
mmetsp:Transcript_18441/g.25370  ORF Transcript_18441/g.25370 Transcript_18441/m.25370 type:complete len:82 (+) Transcript_18441:99-344(+)